MIISKGLDTMEEMLHDMPRYGDIDIMYYRTDVLLHTLRCWLLCQEISGVAKKVYSGKYDCRRAELAMLFHDLPELVTGDINLLEKQRMQQQGNYIHINHDSFAIDSISYLFPENVCGYRLIDILYGAQKKEELEDQLNCVIDKRDGFCETFHEVRAGNIRFIQPMLNYINLLDNIPKMYPGLTKMMTAGHPFLQEIDRAQVEQVAEKAQRSWDNGNFGEAYHTPYSVRQPSGISAYDFWKRLSLRNFGQKPLTLIKQKENGRNPDAEKYVTKRSVLPEYALLASQI